MRKTIYPTRQMAIFFALGIILTMVMSGCAQNRQIQRGRTETSPAPQEKESLPASEDEGSGDKTPEEVTSADEAFGDDDDFFEDEFSIETAHVADPLAPINRAIFTFNDRLYLWGLKPIAQGYRAVVPEPVRLSVGNFFYNIAGVGRMTNCLLQGKIRAAGGEFGRFFVNTTVGLLGLGNPAANYPSLNPQKEDMGQSLGRYGIGEGMYIVLPILGPSTLRDAIGRIGDSFLSPFSYIDPWYVRVSISALDITNRYSFHLGDYEAIKGSALDPYLLFRSGYIQKRRQMVKH